MQRFVADTLVRTGDGFLQVRQRSRRVARGGERNAQAQVGAIEVRVDAHCLAVVAPERRFGAGAGALFESYSSQIVVGFRHIRVQCDRFFESRNRL